MQHLRTHLQTLDVRDAYFSDSRIPQFLPAISPTHLTLPTSDALRSIPLSAHMAAHSIPLPHAVREMVSSGALIALIGDQRVSILHQASGRSYPVGSSLFAHHPSLHILQAAWMPSAPAFLMILTSDWCLRLFDVVTSVAACSERQRIRVVTGGAAPVSFTFGAGDGWHALSVYVLADDGGLYMASPIAPVGTSMSCERFRALERGANRVLQTTGTETTHVKTHTTRRLSFADGEGVWCVRQARLQLRFLHVVFERSGEHMVAVREFKPAPLLFQGPLHVEKEIEEEAYTRILVVATEQQPVVVRVSSTGSLSVLIAMERVEAQWFLSNEGLHDDGVLVASAEYSSCARSVAPCYLCFENVVFESDVCVSAIAGISRCDTLLVASSSALYSLTLSFVSLLGDATALERCAPSVVRQLFTVGNEVITDDGGIVGIAPYYVRGEGAVALVVLANGNVESSNPLRWVDMEVMVPKLISSVCGSDGDDDKRCSFGVKKIGEDVLQSMRNIERLCARGGGRIACGTLGRVNGMNTISSTLRLLEKRVEELTGTEYEHGVIDEMGKMANMLLQWIDMIEERSKMDIENIKHVTICIEDTEKCEQQLTKKINLVKKGNQILMKRISNNIQIMKIDGMDLNHAEIERMDLMNKRMRRLKGIQKRLEAVINSMNIRKIRFQYIIDNKIGNLESWRSKDILISRNFENDVYVALRELRQIEVALHKHAKQIEDAMRIDNSLWKRLSMAAT